MEKHIAASSRACLLPRYARILNLDPPFCAGVASRPARQAAPRPGWARFFSFGVVPPGRCAPCGEGIMKATSRHNPSPHVLTTRTSASRSRKTVDPG